MYLYKTQAADKLKCKDPSTTTDDDLHISCILVEINNGLPSIV